MRLFPPNLYHEDTNMSFLEYLARILMGPPVSGTSWQCPFCGSSRGFSVRPPLPDKPVKFKCFRCSACGDEHDLIQLFRPDLRNDYGRRSMELDRLRAEFEAGGKAEPTAPTRPGTAAGNSCRGRGGQPMRVYDSDANDDVFSPAANNVAEEVTELMAGVLGKLGLTTEAAEFLWDWMCETLHIISRYGLHPDGIGIRASWEAHVIRVNREHMAKFQERLCDWDCCRLKRGWRPEQIQKATEAARARGEAARKKAKQRRASLPKK